MEFEYSNLQIEQALRSCRSLDDVDAALLRVREIQSSFYDSALYGQKLFAPGLDEIMRRLASRMQLADVPLVRSNDNPCIIATEFFRVGGHSRVAREIAALLGDNPPTIILTNGFDRLDRRALVGDLTNPQNWNRRSVLMLASQRPTDKIIELYGLMAALRPSRIFMLTHHMDFVAPVALWPFRNVVDFIHHADHLPALGASLPFGRHVDLTYRCHRACVEAGLGPIYAGLEAKPPAAASPRKARDDGRVRVATCGSAVKYHGGGAWRWTDYALAALADPRTELIHIGPVDDQLRGEIAAALAGAGVDAARYEFVGPAPDLAAELVSREVDVYLSSYPVTGGKANLEAMAAGLYPLVPIDAGAPELLKFELPIGTWRQIEHPDQLAAAIDAVLLRPESQREADREQLRRESERFRSYVRYGEMSSPLIKHSRTAG